MDQGTSSSPVPSSTPPRDSAEIRAVGESIPPAVAAIERMTREIHSRYQSLSMLREAAARVGEEIVQLELERDAIERALEAQHLLRTGQTSLERMDVEEAEAAMAARRVS